MSTKVPRSSREHVYACLTELATCVRTRWDDNGDVKVAFARYADSLMRYDPDVVREACRQAAEEEEFWPPLKRLVERCNAIAAERAEAERRRSLPPPDSELEAINELICYLPDWAMASLHHPTAENGGRPWTTMAPRREILRAMAANWRRLVPPRPFDPHHPDQLPPDHERRLRWARAIAEHTRAAAASGDPLLVAPGRDFAPPERLADEKRPGGGATPGVFDPAGFVKRVTEEL